MYVKTHKTVLYYICSIHTVRLLYFSKADSGTGGSYTVVSKPGGKSNPTSEYIPKGKNITISKSYLHSHVHSSTIHNSQDMETTYL